MNYFRKTTQAFLLAATLLATTPVFAAPSCDSLFDGITHWSTAFNPSSEFKQLETYRLFLKDSNQVISATFVEERGGKLGFETDNGFKQIARDQIVGMTRQVRPGLIGNLNQWVTERVVLAHKLAMLMVKPLRKLVPTVDGVEVVGTLRTSKEVAEKISTGLQSYDAHMTALGFMKPAKTRIIVADKPILPDLIGPFSLSIPTFNIWQGFKEVPVIAMSPLLFKTTAVKDESVLFHERTHSILHATYAEKSYINKNAMIQEALADFSAANFLSQSKMAPNVGGTNRPLRDLETRVNSFSNQSLRRDEVLKALRKDDHGNSLFVSGLLWKVRGQIGEAKTTELLKPLIESLNVMRPSYDARLKSEKRVSVDEVTRFSQDLEFVLAVVTRVGDAQDSQTKALMREATVAYAKDLQLSPERIDQVAASLATDPAAPNLLVKSRGRELVQGLVLKAYGFGAMAVDASLLYWATTVLN